MARASTGSRATTDAERGSSSSAANSPTRSPGPRKASSTVRPVGVVAEIFTRPECRTNTSLGTCPTYIRAWPLTNEREPARARSSAAASAPNAVQKPFGATPATRHSLPGDERRAQAALEVLRGALRPGGAERALRPESAEGALRPGGAEGAI